MSYAYAINQDSNSPLFLINKHIGYDAEDGMGIDGKVFSKEFFEVDSKNPDVIKSIINSLGGCVLNGYDIFGSILNAKSKTETIYAGLAFSTAGWCGMGADIVNAYDYASWMCHLPFNPEAVNSTSEFLKHIANSISIIISEKSGKNGKDKMSVENVLGLMKKKTYYSAQDLYDIGLIDNVIQTGKINIKNTEGVNEDEVVSVYKEYQHLVVNKFIENKNDNTMAFEKVINRLKLADGSGEDSVIAAIARMENEFNAVNKEKTELEAKLKVSNDTQEELAKKLKDAQNAVDSVDASVKNKEKEVADLKEKLEATNKEALELKEKIAAAEIEAKNKETAAFQEKVDTMVQKFVDAGVIKNEETVINAIKAKALLDFDYVEADLKSRPINFEAPVTINLDETPVNSAEVEGSFAWFAAKNQEAIDKAEKEMDEALRQLAGVKVS